MAVKTGNISVPAGLTAALLAATIEAEVLDNDGNAPEVIIKAGTDLRVRVRWTLSGLLAGMIGGSFRAEARFDGAGAIPDFSTTAPDQPAQPLPAGGYSVDVLVPAAAFTGDAYNVTAVLTYIDGLGVAGPIKGFVTLDQIALAP
ncbi:hypothetical protein [Herbidospora daliensis]|uniref:hypothetical protein n=1 Tax=Herbidospora daliensis TaxID=295585 RepID=UPI000A70B90E|nr:hypothetical protein [Herbidospora daliensis]